MSRSKNNQTMKFGQLINITREIFFFKNHAENEMGTSFCFFEKALIEVKASGLQLNFNIFRRHSTWHTITTNCIKL